MASATSKNANDGKKSPDGKNTAGGKKPGQGKPGGKAAKTAARRARIEEQRRAEKARERRGRIITITVSTAIVVSLIGGGWWLLDTANQQEQEQAAPVKGEQSWDDLSQNHVDKQVDYPMTPPVGGDHNAVWQNCNGDVYTEAVTNENAVHSLEHGAVWITYNADAADADVKALTEKVRNTPYTMISPYEDTASPITLSAWGHQLKVTKASDARIDEFLEKYVQGPQTPEPGAACTGGKAA
ncbi:DUF3105 domain-containing protein [Streptomyces sp. NPDC048290]|uniref:DUF3105 domain-containing protein n=1 Tax=Streptomyces sp. NPDC048290 TaxID=3155811 RepID=UPI00342F6E46